MGLLGDELVGLFFAMIAADEITISTKITSSSWSEISGILGEKLALGVGVDEIVGVGGDVGGRVSVVAGVTVDVGWVVG